MSKPTPKSIDIFLTLGRHVVEGYFNKHDPSPIYKRQLSHQFEDYIMASVRSAKRYSVIFYKLKCTSDFDKQYAEPLMYAIRKHFEEKLEIKNTGFLRFKRRSWMVLAVSISVVILFHSLLPSVINEENGVHSGLINSLDIFSWVLLWHPIDELIFHWNPHLKEIGLLRKLARSEYILINASEKMTVVDNKSIYENEDDNMGDHTLRIVSDRSSPMFSRNRAVL